MKSVIVYYSYSGNTHRAAQALSEALREKGDEVRPVRIRPLKEDKNFLTQCVSSFFRKKPELYKTLLDLGDFDRVIIGSPVWAFKPAPPVNTYLSNIGSLEGKEAISFVTYGSGTGKDKALKALKSALEKKGAKSVKTISFQQDQPAQDCKNEFLKLLASPC